MDQSSARYYRREDDSLFFFFCKNNLGCLIERLVYFRKSNVGMGIGDPNSDSCVERLFLYTLSSKDPLSEVP